MKSAKNILYPILFGILMVLLFLPLAQEHLGLFKMKPLNGVYEPTKKPEFIMEDYASGNWQTQVEPYVSENFGFREPIIRLYNQYVYDFFNKTYSQEVSIGKDGWLYQKDGVVQYFGLMGQRYGLSEEQFRENLDIETRSLMKIRTILKEYGVELMTFTLPVKSYIYPEHLRRQHQGNTLFDAGEYYDQRLREFGFPHMNMTPWFEDIRDDYPFTLFYEKGSHWASGAVIGTDSLLRFMETLKGERFPRIVIGEPYEVPENEMNPQDKDLSALLNTIHEPKQKMPLYEFPVSIAIDSTTVYPNVLFVGSSYYWYMTARIPFAKLFSNRDFMFYNYTYFTDEEQKWQKMEQVNTLTELLTHDYVVYFQNAPQLYSDGFQFFGKALIALCISDERLKEKTNEVADSLAVAWADEHPDWQQSHFLYHAKTMLFKHPEMFEELRGEEVPTPRNPKIENVLAQRNIRANHEWRFLINAKAQNDSIDANALYATEAYNLLNGRPLLRNNAYFTTYDYFNYLIDETFKTLGHRPETPSNRDELLRLAFDEVEARIEHHDFDTDSLMMAACVMNTIVKNLGSDAASASLKDKAAERGFSIDKMFREDVAWCFNNIKDWTPYINENTIQTAWELYKIERQMRKDPKTMSLINQKRQDENLPFRIAINRELLWLYNQRN